MSFEVCPKCGKLMSKKEIGYSLSHFGNKNCKVCEKKKYDVVSTRSNKRKVNPATVTISDDHKYKSNLDLGLNRKHSSSANVSLFGANFFEADGKTPKFASQSEMVLTDAALDKLETQMNTFPTKNIGLLIGAIVAFFIPVVGPIIAIVLVAVWRAKRKQ